VKCPKCDYLGFETGDRCKNCGYDFSLMADAGPPPGPERIELDLDLHESAIGASPSKDWLAEIDGTLSGADAERQVADRGPLTLELPEPATAPNLRAAPEFPLLTLAIDDSGDEPLIKLPAAPRPPLVVRRTPDTPRLRRTPQPVREIEPALALAFDDVEGRRLKPKPHVKPARPHVSRVWADPNAAKASSAGARLAAAAIDHAMLCGIDVAVLYFTLRMAGLSMSEWRMLPPAPLVVFLLLVKLSYFCAFTAVGGQTIGKMAARIRVVGADDRPVDAALAMRRTLAGLVSAALLGLGFLPALFGSDRRALHDRMARTRVIALPSA
jgi:uncharacterized RDD family membrane protein YckC